MEILRKLKDDKVNRKLIYRTINRYNDEEACLTGLGAGVLALQGLQLWKIRYAVGFGEILRDLSEKWPCTRFECFAPAHASNVSQEWPRSKNINFISKNECPPSRPDLNPLDYSVWANLETMACAKPHKNVDSLKNSLLHEWQKIPQEE